jgi:hypothetical protein
LFIIISHYDLDHHFIKIPNFNLNDHSQIHYLFPVNLPPLFKSLSHLSQSLSHLFLSLSHLFQSQSPLSNNYLILPILLNHPYNSNQIFFLYFNHHNHSSFSSSFPSYLYLYLVTRHYYHHEDYFI